jgi:hypothetical protein
MATSDPRKVVTAIRKAALSVPDNGKSCQPVGSDGAGVALTVGETEATESTMLDVGCADA